MKELLESKVIIVTGAAGGIGAAAATHFAEQGAAVVLTDIKNNEAYQAARELKARGHPVINIGADLLVEEEVTQLFDQAAKQFGRIDGAFCNAGIGYQQRVEETDSAAFDRVMAVNVRSVFLTCKHAFRLMRPNQSGSIVITSSRAALAAYPHMSPYIASKGALLSMTRALAVDFGSHGIRVNAVLPGATETPMFKEEVEASGRPSRCGPIFKVRVCWVAWPSLPILLLPRLSCCRIALVSSAEQVSLWTEVVWPGSMKALPLGTQ